MISPIKISDFGGRAFAFSARLCMVNERGRKAVEHLTASDHSEPDKEVRAMANCGQYPDSGGDFNRNISRIRWGVV